MFIEIYKRISFWKNVDRIGPDIPYTHWRLHFKSTMLRLCKKKFKYFDNTAEFRPGAYAVGCSKISIGRRVVIRPGTMLCADPEEENGEGIVIKDNVLIGPGVQIIVQNHKFDDSRVPIIDQGHERSRKIILEEGCWIGSNSIILPGVAIGRNAVIGAGSVVTKNVPDKVVAVGNPARVLKKIES